MLQGYINIKSTLILAELDIHTMKMIKRKHEILFDIGNRRLIYPLDTAFIHDLDSNLARKWIKAGWNVENTTLLEINSPTIPGNQPPQIGTPSELFSGVIYAWSKQVYFRVVVFSKGFFDNHSDLVLRIDAWHEKQHIINAEEHVRNGTKILREDDVVKKEVEYVLKTFGKEGFQARRDDVLADEERLKNSDAIPGFLAMLWLREYFGRHYKKYVHNTFPIPSTEYAKTLRQAYGKAALNSIRVYDILDEDVSVLFKYTFQDIGV